MIKVKIYIDNRILETEVKDISRDQLFNIVQLQLATREYIHLGGIIVDKRHLRALEFSDNFNPKMWIPVEAGYVD